MYYYLTYITYIQLVPLSPNEDLKVHYQIKFTT